MDDKITIVQSVALQRVILKTLGELTQFQEGLQCLGVQKELANHGEILRDFYVKRTRSRLTAGSYGLPGLFGWFVCSCPLQI